MAGKNTAVFGIYPSLNDAEEGAEHLRAQGFRNTDISMLVSENQGTKDLGHEKGSKAPEGAANGAVLGGIIGGLFGWLLSIGAISVPQLRALASAGPIIASLAGAGAVGGVCLIIGAIAGKRIPEYRAVRYSGRVREGAVLVSVHCDNNRWVRQAKVVLRHTGALDIASGLEERGDFAVSDKPMPRYATPAAPPKEQPKEDMPPAPLRTSQTPGRILVEEEDPHRTGGVDRPAA